MKIRNLTRLGALAISLTMVTTSLMGGTLAKYTTTVLGTDTVTMARFGYEANDGADDVEFTTDSAIAIDLFDDLTTNATDTVQTDAEDYYYLAPGTYGSFDIELNGLNSDVDIEMVGSTVELTIDDGEANTAGLVDSDEFLSYTITYNVYTDTGVYTTNTIGGVVNGAYNESTSTDPYERERTDLATLQSDLQRILSTIVLEKNTIGVISVSYAWVSYNNETNLDSDDTALGQKIVGYNTLESISSTAPEVTIEITNVASQCMSAVASSGYTDGVYYDSDSSIYRFYTTDGGSQKPTD